MTMQTRPTRLISLAMPIDFSGVRVGVWARDRGLSYLSYSVSRLGRVSFGPDFHRADYGMALSKWILKYNHHPGTLRLGYPPLGV